MALTWPRFLLVGVLAAVVIAALILRDGGDRRPRRWHGDVVLSLLADENWRASRRLADAADHLRVLQLRDSLRAAWSRRNAMEHREEFDRSLPRELQELLQRTRRRASASRPARGDVPVDLVFVNDTVSRVRKANRLRYSYPLSMHYLLPSSSTQGRCIALTTLRLNSAYVGGVAARLKSDVIALRMLGPCAFYEDFGEPGVAIADWLRRGGWMYGQLGAWRESLPPLTDSEASWAQLPIADWSLRRHISPQGYRCVAGDAAACVTAFMSPNPLRYSDVWGRTIVSFSGILFDIEGYGWAERSLGPRDWTLLGELARDLGAERFRKFWQSDRSPPEAFRAATGEELGDWLHRWTLQSYGVHRVGPGVTAGAALMALLVVIATLGLGLRAAEHRYIA